MDGRTAINIPKPPSPASNHRKNLIFIDHHKWNRQIAQKFQNLQNTCCCCDKGVALAGGRGTSL